MSVSFGVAFAQIRTVTFAQSSGVALAQIRAVVFTRISGHRFAQVSELVLGQICRHIDRAPVPSGRSKFEWRLLGKRPVGCLSFSPPIVTL